MLQQLHKHYQEFRSLHPTAVADFTSGIRSILTDAGLTYDQVSVRVKEWRSLRTKARKKNPAGEPLYPTPWEDIHDLVGVRITTYHSMEIPSIISALSEEFTVIRSVDKTAQTRVSGGFGYGSHHLILRIDGHEDLQDYDGLIFEIQVRTVLQHAWAEFEHNIRYKRHGKLDPQIDRAFTLAAGLIELADQQFDLIAALEEPQQPTDDAMGFNARTLPGIIALLVGNSHPTSRAEDYEFLEDVLAAHEITTVRQLRQLLNPDTMALVTSCAPLSYQPGQVRLVDDALLAQYGQEHIDKTGHMGHDPQRRPGKLRSRVHALTGGK